MSIPAIHAGPGEITTRQICGSTGPTVIETWGKTPFNTCIAQDCLCYEAMTSSPKYWCLTKTKHNFLFMLHAIINWVWLCPTLFPLQDLG